MLLISRLGAILQCAIISLAVVGCGDSDGPATTQHIESSGPPATMGPPHAHAHASTGPHGGTLIELGDEYHAELSHDDAAGTVTIFILDASGKNTLPIDGADISVNLKHDGRGDQFKLAASPDASDPAGKSSRFVSSEKELAEDLDHEDAEPQLAVVIDGKQYRGVISHGHEHSGEHGDDDHHDH